MAIAEVRGAAAALAELDPPNLDHYHHYHATSADLLARLGRADDARAAYDRAIELADNTAERAFLAGRREQLRDACPPSHPAE